MIKTQHAIAALVGSAADGPARVHDAFPIYAANRAGAETAPEDWRVISLCRVGRMCDS